MGAVLPIFEFLVGSSRDGLGEYTTFCGGDFYCFALDIARG